MDGVLSRRAWLGAAGATAAAAALSACGSSTHTESTTTVTVPAGVPITERSRPDITDPDTALAKLKKGNARFVTAQMLHPDQGPQTAAAVAGPEAVRGGAELLGLPAAP
jgi:carbonic anhydrase